MDRILREARAHDNKALISIDQDPGTAQLLGLLPERDTEQARRHLDGARIWKRQQADKALGKLDAAQSALEGLDIRLARGILRKIDSEVLEEPAITRYDDLLLAVEARSVELEEIAGQVPPPAPDEKKRRRFWRR